MNHVTRQFGRVTVTLTANGCDAEGPCIGEVVAYDGQRYSGAVGIADTTPLLRQDGMTRLWLAPPVVDAIAAFESAHGL